MKFNSTVLLTASLAIAMLGAGAASALYSFNLGHQALQGVNQPDVNPAKKLAKQQQNSNEVQAFKPVDEKAILKQVRNYINGKAEVSSRETKAKDPADQKVADEQANDNQAPQTSQKKPDQTESANFPLTAQNDGVTMEVTDVSQQGGSLVLEVNLKNESAQARQFLYSFLDIKGDRGESLSAIADGLPAELPPNGETFAGKLSIPLILVDGEKRISLSLTDYPDQSLQLNIADIPVVK
jgi:hypothetical protein